MTATTAEPAAARGNLLSGLIHRQLDAYPETPARIFYLALTVLATVTLYYELYVGGSVSVQLLGNLHMSFTFYVVTLAVGNLLGAFGSLFAGLTDRYGRANLVVFGLLCTGVLVAFAVPAATDKWTFTIETFVVGIVEGICLVATPALIRDFSPQVGRATAMGFWTCGPVVGSLIVAVVGSNTIPATLSSMSHFWSHEYRICGIAGLVVFVIALLFLRELSPQLRDQLMVTMRDRALIEAKAKGIDIESALKNPWRTVLKPDVIVSAFAVSVMLLVYYTAVGFLVIYLSTVFGFSTRDANGLGNWEWGSNVLALIVVGVVSDRFRVRKPFMVVGGVVAAVMLVVYLLQAGHHPSYYTVAVILAILSIGLGIAYTPWMASFTETVEHRNPALTATGLAVWGWILRVVVFLSFLLVPVVINSVTPLVNYGSAVQANVARYPVLTWAGTHSSVVADAQKYSAQLTFARQNPSVVADAQQYSSQLAFAQANPTIVADAQKFAPELAVISEHLALFEQAQAAQAKGSVPASLQQQLVAAAGGGAKGEQVLATISQNQAAITSLIPYQTQLAALAQVPPSVLAEAQQYSSQLAALSKVPPAVLAEAQQYSTQLTALAQVPASVTSYMAAHAADVQTAAGKTAGQWKTWYWICFGGIIFFLLSIPLLRGHWRPSDARREEEAHEALVQAELARLGETPA